jgi:hypothetical protein
MSPNIAKVLTRFLILSAFSFGLTACGGGGGSGGSAANNGLVEDTLTNLGVDITVTSRETGVGVNKAPLPEDYTPIGAAKTFEKFDELAVIGLTPANIGVTSDATVLKLVAKDTSVSYDTEPMLPALGDTPWASSVGAAPAALRVAARGDVDRDGQEELLVVYRAPGQDTIELQLYEDQTQSFALGQKLFISTEQANSLAVASGDFNGDGYVDLVIGLVFNDFAKLLFVQNDKGTLSLASSSKILPQTLAGSEITLIIKTGNLDNDPSNELVAVVNELYKAGTEELGKSNYFVFDDANNGYSQRDTGLVRAVKDTLNKTAMVADVSLGDVDGDNIDEIVFAGLEHFDPDKTCSYDYLIVELDDLTHSAVPLDAAVYHSDTSYCPGNNGFEMRFVHVNTPDLDGDDVAEIQANEVIFTAGNLLSPAYTIPIGNLFGAGRFSYQNSAMVTGDLSSDKRQDIILYSQLGTDVGLSSDRIEDWGIGKAGPSPIDGTPVDQGWRMIHSIAVVPPASPDDLRPVLVPINVDQDSLAISFDEGEHKLIFTEPVLLAAIATPPCYTGHHTSDCTTTYGTSTSNTVTADETLTTSLGSIAGWGWEQAVPVEGTKAAGLEVTGTVNRHISFTGSKSYALTRTVSYSNSSNEDSVIFTSIPYDLYTYTILSAPPDPDSPDLPSTLIGSKIFISLPRTAVTLQLPRADYNAKVVHGGPKIDSSVFTHTAGDPRSYPNATQKDALLAKYGGSNLLLGRWGFGNGPADASFGNGLAKTLGINFAQETGGAVAVGIKYELEVKATTATVIFGFTVGVASESSLQILHGTATDYSGTVGNMDTDWYNSGHQYSWGLFTYPMDDHASGQEFEVINYWVE